MISIHEAHESTGCQNPPSRLGGGIQVGVRSQFRMLPFSNQQVQSLSIMILSVLSLSLSLFLSFLSIYLYFLLYLCRGSSSFPILAFSPVANGVEGEDLDETMAVGFAEARDVCG